MVGYQYLSVVTLLPKTLLLLDTGVDSLDLNPELLSPSPDGRLRVGG